MVRRRDHRLPTGRRKRRGGTSSLERRSAKPMTLVSARPAKLPWMKFFPTDWRSDPALRMCSIGARGLWMEMLCLMHEAEPYGFLHVNGNALNDYQLASQAGIQLNDVVGFLKELETQGSLQQEFHQLHLFSS